MRLCRWAPEHVIAEAVEQLGQHGLAGDELDFASDGVEPWRTQGQIELVGVVFDVVEVVADPWFTDEVVD